MRRQLLLGALVFAAGGCAVIAGLEDRDPVDELDAAIDGGANDGSAIDGTLDGATGDGNAGGDAMNDGTPPSDGGMDQTATDGPAGDAADSSVDSGTVSYEGVWCGATICDAAVGCCVLDASCQSVVECPGTHASCDGPEDCTGGDPCCSVAANGAGLCNSGGGCGTYRCNRDEDCTFSTAHKCCPEPQAPQYGKCVAGPSCN
jgi:hypothetical protein